MDFKRKIDYSYPFSTGKNAMGANQHTEKEPLSLEASVSKAPLNAKTQHKKFSNLSLRCKTSKQATISPCVLRNSKQDEKNKRLPEQTPDIQCVGSKKQKVTKITEIGVHKETKTQEIGSDLLEDTLDICESTQVLINRSKKFNVNLLGNLVTEDKKLRVVHEMQKGCTKIHPEINNIKGHANGKSNCNPKVKYVVEKESNDSENAVDTGLTQFFMNTQVLKQIDNAISREASGEALEESDTNEDENDLDKSFKIPETIPTKSTVLKTTSKASSNSKTQAGSKLNENSSPSQDIFSVELQSQCRREVNTIFEQLEQSIYLMGTSEESAKKKLPDEVLDIIFCPDKITEATSPEEMIAHAEAMHEQGIANIDWSNETLLNATGINSSFGSILKQALEANASKSVNVEKSTNKSFVEKSVTFISAGPFYGLPVKVKDLIRHFKGIESLYDWQDECLKLPAIKERKNLIYALPTSGGKTLVAEILILREIMCYKRNALFILPYVAIVQEKVWALSPFAVALDFLVEEYAASKGTYPPRKRRRKNSVYIATIEKALGLINSLIETERLNEVGLIVVDELHLIGEQGRGATLEALLTKLVYLKANIHIVGMSATIGNLEDVQKFLNADVYTQNFRPVELTEYIKCGNEIAKINWNAKTEEDLFVLARTSDFSYSDTVSNIDPDRLAGLVMEVIPKGSCLIFCSSKKNCENVAILLSRIVFPKLKEHKKGEKEQLLNALKDEGGSLCKILKVSVQFGIAYHHSGLTNEERRLIEDGFRSGVISVICCTSTLAAGVNLPAQRVILRQPYIGREFISLSRYKQMVGRAGRAGLGEAGDSIVICTQQDLPKLKKLFMSPMDQALSGLHLLDGKGFRHLLLSCISLGIAKTKSELLAMAGKTLLSVQYRNLEVDVKKLAEKAICELFRLGALQISNIKQLDESNTPISDISIRLESTASSLDTSGEIESQNSKKKKLIVTNHTKLLISKLGSAAIKGGLDLNRAHMLYDDLVEAQRSLVLLDALHLLYLVTPYEISEQIKPNMTIYYTLFSQLGEKELQTAKILGLNESVAVRMLANQPIKNVSQRVLNRFYLTLMLYDLWNEKSVFEVSDKYQINRGIVQNLMTASASFSSNVVNFCDELEEFWAFAYLLRGMSQRLSHCCIKELLPLMELPAVKQSRAKQLYNAGYKTLQSIAKANADDLAENIEYMSKRVANQLIAASKMLLLEKIENLREEAEDVLDGVENPKSFLNRTHAH